MSEKQIMELKKIVRQHKELILRIRNHYLAPSGRIKRRSLYIDEYHKILIGVLK